MIAWIENHSHTTNEYAGIYEFTHKSIIKTFIAYLYLRINGYPFIIDMTKKIIKKQNRCSLHIERDQDGNKLYTTETYYIQYSFEWMG